MSSAKKSGDLAARIAKAGGKVNGSAAEKPAEKVAPAAKKGAAAKPAKQTAAAKPKTEKPAKPTKEQKAEAKQGLDLVIANLGQAGSLNANNKKALRKRLEDDAAVHQAAELLSRIILEVANARVGTREILSMPDELATLISTTLDLSVVLEEGQDPITSLDAFATHHHVSPDLIRLAVKHLQSKLSVTKSEATIPVTYFALNEDWKKLLEDATTKFNEKRAKSKNSSSIDLDHLPSRDFATLLIMACADADAEVDHAEHGTAIDLGVDVLTKATKPVKE
jgi:hypothetical protein